MITDIKHLKNDFYYDSKNEDIIIHKDGLESYKTYIANKSKSK